ATIMMTEAKGAFEREGQARARLAAPVSELAAGLCTGTGVSDDRRGVDALRPSAFAIARRGPHPPSAAGNRPRSDAAAATRPGRRVQSMGGRGSRPALRPAGP